MGLGRAGRQQSGQDLSYTEIGRNIDQQSRVYTRAGPPAGNGLAGNRLKIAQQGHGPQIEPKTVPKNGARIDVKTEARRAFARRACTRTHQLIVASRFALRESLRRKEGSFFQSTHPFRLRIRSPSGWARLFRAPGACPLK
jgi:hypothetical protein